MAAACEFAFTVRSDSNRSYVCMHDDSNTRMLGAVLGADMLRMDSTSTR